MELAKTENKDFINLGVVLNNEGEILLIRRARREIGKGGAILNWAFPGGLQREKEDKKECVRRKVLEETGYAVVWVEEISSRVHPQFPLTIFYHLCRLNSSKQVAEPKEPHEVAEIRWVKPEEIRSLITTDLDPRVAKILGLG